MKNKYNVGDVISIGSYQYNGVDPIEIINITKTYYQAKDAEGRNRAFIKTNLDTNKTVILLKKGYITTFKNL